MNKVIKPWGHFLTLYQDNKTWTKVITINPGESLSLQYHNKRVEEWIPIDAGIRARINDDIIDLTQGVCYTVGKQVLHRVWNPTESPVRLVEVAVGQPSEEDIVRKQDRYGRTNKDWS